MASKNHTHKYILRNIGKVDKPIKVYACAFPDCSHHMPFGSESLLIGKKTICHQCLKETIIIKPMIDRMIVKPRCHECRTGTPINANKNRPKAKEASMDSAIDMLLKMRM